jgi:hypothetical protein
MAINKVYISEVPPIVLKNPGKDGTSGTSGISGTSGTSGISMGISLSDLKNVVSQSIDFNDFQNRIEAL